MHLLRHCVFLQCAIYHPLQGCWPLHKSILLVAGGASQSQNGQESMQQAECKGKAQGADADQDTGDPNTGASQPHAAPAPDLNDLADSRGYAVIGPDVSTS